MLNMEGNLVTEQNDEELEQLLGEIPRATSGPANLEELQRVYDSMYTNLSMPFTKVSPVCNRWSTEIPYASFQQSLFLHEMQQKQAQAQRHFATQQMSEHPNSDLYLIQCSQHSFDDRALAAALETLSFDDDLSGTSCTLHKETKYRTAVNYTVNHASGYGEVDRGHLSGSSDLRPQLETFSSASASSANHLKQMSALSVSIAPMRAPDYVPNGYRRVAHQFALNPVLLDHMACDFGLPFTQAQQCTTVLQSAQRLQQIQHIEQGTLSNSQIMRHFLSLQHQKQLREQHVQMSFSGMQNYADSASYLAENGNHNLSTQTSPFSVGLGTHTKNLPPRHQHAEFINEGSWIKKQASWDYAASSQLGSLCQPDEAQNFHLNARPLYDTHAATIMGSEGKTWSFPEKVSSRKIPKVANTIAGAGGMNSSVKLTDPSVVNRCYNISQPCENGNNFSDFCSLQARPKEERFEYDLHKLPGIPHILQYRQQFKYSSLKEVEGRIFAIAKDQHGCRFLQRKFDEGDPEEVQKIFMEIIDHIVELMIDPFGNYLVQKLFEVCNKVQRMEILHVVTRKEELVDISLNMHGTRAVQKLIESLKSPVEVSMVIISLRQGVVTLSKDLNGNHVVQRCLQRLSTEDNQFIFDAAASHCVDIATHRHGCCVLQRCIDFASGSQHQRLVAEIASNALVLSQDQYGNYVVQYVLDLGIPWASLEVMVRLEENYVFLSMQKFSSNVVEKCLKQAVDDNQARIVHELMTSSLLGQLLQDPFGNYVVQCALTVSKGALHKGLVEAICPHLPALRSTPYGKRILSCANFKSFVVNNLHV